MRILSKPLAISGMLIVGLVPLFLPFLRVPIKGNWNLYQTDLSLFGITYLLLSLLVLFFILRSVNLYALFTKIYLAWCLVGFAAVYLKINNYFGFKLVDGLLAKTLHLGYGWAVLFVGALLLVFSCRKVSLQD